MTTYPEGESPEESLAYYKSFSMDELRRRQNNARRRIEMAHEQRNPYALEVAQRMETCLCRAMYEKTFR